jgi:hypothetical protein
MTFQTNHLNHEQLCDLLLANRADTWPLESPEIERSREHVRNCHVCADELATLNHSLDLFRSTADAWASHEWHSHQSLLQSSSLKPAPVTNGFSAFFAKPVVWATAAAVALFAAALPVTLHYWPDTSKPTSPVAVVRPADTQSDEALLLEINQTLSSSVPTPMQPLADPTAGSNNQSNATRKN